MANQWFKFKKFTIQQDMCAMKVGTDGVLLGAWTNLEGIHSVLDIGTGTGLLGLMLAQRSSQVNIDALEIDAAAANQAAQNVANSSFYSQIHVKNQDFNVFLLSCTKKYDLILSNPPFFKDSLKPEMEERKLARHSDTLSMDQIISGARKLLSCEGRLSLIIPSDILIPTVDSAKANHLFPCRKINVRPVPGKETKRTCIEFSFQEREIIEQSIIIEDRGRHQYSEDYIKLTREFYLGM